MMTLQDTVRVMIADDNFDMRLLVRATLGSDARVDVVAERPETKVLLFSAYLTPEITDAADELGMVCLRKDLFMELPNAVVGLARDA